MDNEQNRIAEDQVSDKEGQWEEEEYDEEEEIEKSVDEEAIIKAKENLVKQRQFVEEEKETKEQYVVREILEKGHEPQEFYFFL